MSPSTNPAARSSYAQSYLRMSGNCTILLARQMLSFLPSSCRITPSSYILDSACGPGIVTAEIKHLHPSAKILAADLSPAMLEEVEATKISEGWQGVETKELDVRQLTGVEDRTFSHVFANLGLPVPGDEEGGIKALSEAFRVTRVGGVVVFSTWADRVWPSAFLSTARTIHPHEEPKNPMALSPELLSGSWLLSQFEKGGFGNNVEIHPCTTYTSATSLDELVENMMFAKGMFFLGYSEEELQRARKVFADELRKLRTFEEVDGGGVRVGMKAWIAVGMKMGDEDEAVF